MTEGRARAVAMVAAAWLLLAGLLYSLWASMPPLAVR